jgi:GT2 family glycosyltransferase
MAARVLDIELTSAPAEVPLDPHDAAFVVVRVHGHPIGAVRVPCPDRVLTADRLRVAVDETPGLAARAGRRLVLDALLPDPTPVPRPTSWSVVVCTRDRPEQLERCLKSILDLEDRPPQVLVVDNAPSTPHAEQLARSIGVDYLLEPVPGLNRARRLAIDAAAGDVVLFTDDDVCVDRRWASAMLEPFAAPRVAAVTGLVLPIELETDAQERFEARGGFSRGFERKRHGISSLRPEQAGSLGAGASMAFRRDVARSLGLFDDPIDCGTPSRSGGDTYAIYRVLRSGWQVEYTPDALGWHEHRRDHAALRSTLAGYSTGAYTWLLKALIDHHELGAAREMAVWFREHHVRRLRAALTRRSDREELDLVLAEIRGVLAAPRAYVATRGRR